MQKSVLALDLGRDIDPHQNVKLEANVIMVRDRKALQELLSVKCLEDVHLNVKCLDDVRFQCAVPIGWNLRLWNEFVLAAHPDHAPRQVAMADLPLPFAAWEKVKP